MSDFEYSRELYHWLIQHSGEEGPEQREWLYIQEELLK